MRHEKTQQLNQQAITEIIESVEEKRLSKIKSLLLFLGHAHSGHSIIGAIIDSHPQTCISNETNLAKLMCEFDLSKKQIEAVLYYFSRKNNSSAAWHNTEYKYNIPLGFQGKTSTPVIVGDKKGGATTRLFMKNPEVFDKLKSYYGENLKIINVHRNPIDVIAAYAYYWQQPIGVKHLERFIENDQANLTFKKQVKSSQWLDIQQAEFIQNPQLEMSKVFNFLAVESTQDQLTNWTKIVKKDVVGKSHKFNIPKTLLAKLERYLADKNQ